MDESRVQRSARYALAGIRFVNGALGVVAPRLLIARVENERPPSSAAMYAFRMFGIRTVLLALEIVVVTESARRRALRRAVLIHASDTASVASLTAGGVIHPRRGILLTAISATNVALAVVALGPKPLDGSDAPAARGELERVRALLW